MFNCLKHCFERFFFISIDEDFILIRKVERNFMIILINHLSQL